MHIKNIMSYLGKTYAAMTISILMADLNALEYSFWS